MAQFRLRPEVWAAFGEATTRAGTDRAAVLRAFVAWYLREPGAELPERPPAPEPEQPSSRKRRRSGQTET
jgi:hypothetical protein